MNRVYLLITGSVASSIVGKVEVSYAFEFIPKETSLIYVNMDMTPAGARTLDFTINILKRYKKIS